MPVAPPPPRGTSDPVSDPSGASATSARAGLIASVPSAPLPTSAELGGGASFVLSIADASGVGPSATAAPASVPVLPVPSTPFGVPSIPLPAPSNAVLPPSAELIGTPPSAQLASDLTSVTAISTVSAPALMTTAPVVAGLVTAHPLASKPCTVKVTGVSFAGRFGTCNFRGRVLRSLGGNFPG